MSCLSDVVARFQKDLSAGEGSPPHTLAIAFLPALCGATRLQVTVQGGAAAAVAEPEAAKAGKAGKGRGARKAARVRAEEEEDADSGSEGGDAAEAEAADGAGPSGSGGTGADGDGGVQAAADKEVAAPPTATVTVDAKIVGPFNVVSHLASTARHGLPQPSVYALYTHADRGVLSP